MQSAKLIAICLLSELVGCWASEQDGLLAARASSDDNSPKALEIGASQYFEGIDGPWSTFDLRVGTPEQDVRVLVSTASPESLVVLSQYGCSDAVFQGFPSGEVPSDCAVSRGKLFNPNDSSTYQELGLYSINGDGVGLEANLGYSANAYFALENLGLGLTGPSLENQTIAGIATAEPFYLGLFGLNTQPVNLSSLGNYSAPSFITTLKDQGQIPSLSWSYTAGAKYQLKQVYGQLILSGYDTSRFEENSVSFTMADDLTRDLVVALQSISYSGQDSAVLLSDSIDIFIDSTDPNLWLPGEVCDAFEDAFGLTVDGDSGLYLVNDTQREDLLNSDAEVSFRISDVSSGGDTVTITLPYAAFDLQAEYPLVENTSYYFPLKRADNETQYTLGRVFLQEAYLSADYERGVFNVSACTWIEGADENIVTILSKDAGSTTSSGGDGSGSSTLGGGAIAGIVVGAVLALLLAAGAVVFFRRRQRKKAAYAAAEPEPDMAVLAGPVHNSHSVRTGRTGKYYSPETIGTSTNDGSHGSNSRNPSNQPSSTSHQPGSGSGSGSAGLLSVSNNSGSNARSRTTTTTTTTDGSPSAQQQQQQVTPSSDAELDGNAPQIYQLHGESSTAAPQQQQPAPVFELGGSEIQRTASDRAAAVDKMPAREEREEEEEGEGEEQEPGDHHHTPPSPYISTLGSTGLPAVDASSDLVSPATPTYRDSKRFSRNP
ncbi:acid protease [Xylariomycetidae sp. FL0641]|nr:acid protease [Xylariomycetidae sp. FL0641]